MVCDCLVELSHVFIDKTFTYKIKEEALNKIKIGMRVEVPFGNIVLEGFVLNIRQNNEEIPLKEIIKVIDNYPILNDELLKLGHFIKENTMCTLISAYQAMLPVALKAKIKTNYSPKLEKYISLNNLDLENIKLTPKQEQIINLLKTSSPIKKTELELISKSSIKTLLDKNIITISTKEKYRLNLTKEETKPNNLNDKQQEIYK